MYTLHFSYYLIFQVERCDVSRMGGGGGDTIKLVFWAFNDNLLAQNQSDRVHMSFSIFCCVVEGLWDVLWIVVSSANKTDLSLVYMINSSGPRTLPCGTPHVTSRLAEYMSQYDTLAGTPPDWWYCQINSIIIDYREQSVLIEWVVWV